MSTALITGGLGLIGSNIAKNLISNGVVEKVVCLDHYGRYSASTRPTFHDYRKLRIQGYEDKVIVERGEAKYYSVCSRVIRRHRPKFVFHLAALPLAKLDNLNTEEAREGSVDATSCLLEIIGEMKAESGYCPEKFIYASSSMVYGDFKEDVATEDHPTHPKEIYGTMKLAGEKITKGLGDYFGIPTAIIRPSAVYGPTDMNRRVSQIFIEKAFLGETLMVNGVDESLDFTYVEDIAQGFVLAAVAKTESGEVFNITYGKAHTLLQFVEALKPHFPDLKYEVNERDSFRPKRGTLSIEKAKTVLGYNPRVGLEEGVGHYVGFLKEHSDLIQNP